MKIKRLLLLGVLLTFLSGCNIVLRVGEGGTVTYGGQTCRAGQQCIIPVTNFRFSEVFRARPADGFRFVGWRKRDRGLCGGTSGPCELSTAELPRNNAIRAFFDSDDERFFLIAEFEATGGGGGGGGGGGNASACFNAELLSQGTQGVFRYRTRVPGEGTIDVDQEFMVMGQRRFNGQQAIETVFSLQEFVEGILADVEITTYTRVNAASSFVRNIGSIAEASAQGITITTTTTFEPFSETRFDLSPGQSYEDRYTAVSEIESPAFPPGFGQSIRTNVRETRTYIGRERITVPAGSYNTCKFELQSRAGGSTDTITTWVIVGNGVLAKEEASDGTVLELLPGSRLNGSSI
ncbi:MAG: hypothetical protein AAGI11_00110 [Pseudomonadota bacterium]